MNGHAPPEGGTNGHKRGAAWWTSVVSAVAAVLVSGGTIARDNWMANQMNARTSVLEQQVFINTGRLNTLEPQLSAMSHDVAAIRAAVMQLLETETLEKQRGG